MLIEKSAELFEKFQNILQKKGTLASGQYEAWIRSARLRLELVRGNEQEILEKEGDETLTFYQGLIYLNREDLISLEKSAGLYEECMSTEETCPVYMNFFIACIRICTHKDADGDQKAAYLEKAEEASELIKSRFVLGWNEQKIFYSNELFLYMMLKDSAGFWKAAAELPGELKYDHACARYIIQMYMKGGEREKAQEYLEELRLRCGDTAEIRGLQELIREGILREEYRPPVYCTYDDREVERLRNALNRIKNLPERENALVRLQTDTWNDPEEANLLGMVLTAVKKMEQYTDLFMYDSQTACENSYSKLVQILFNQREKEVWDFYMMDQPQEGTATDKNKNKRQSSGSVDLLICHDNDAVGIIESIKLTGAVKDGVETHVRKVAGYNYANVRTAFQLILADTKDVKSLWEKYEHQILENIRIRTLKNDWYISQRVPGEEIELIQAGAVRSPAYLCMTIHQCRSTGQSFHMYHIMVDIRKAAAKEEAVKARKV